VLGADGRAAGGAAGAAVKFEPDRHRPAPDRRGAQLLPQALRGQEIASYYASQERPDADFEDASPATAERDLRRLVAEQEAARQAVAGIPLEEIFVNPRWGEMSLRWALIHMIGEYAGHTGQADLIRERIDGKAGWW
jgi:hypothetical protein